MRNSTFRAPSYIHKCITEFYLEQRSAEYLPYGAGRIEKAEEIGVSRLVTDMHSQVMTYMKR